MQLSQWLKAATQRIDRLDARLLVQEATGLTHAALLAQPERELTEVQQARLDAWVMRRAAGEPLAYLVGWAEFRGLRLTVSSAVLVPRPETEELVERVLLLMTDPTSEANSRNSAVTAATVSVLDLGTGSGAIPLALKHVRPGWQVSAVDVSADALAVAQANAARLALDVSFYESSWYGNLPAGLQVDCVVSNPPYIPNGDPHLQGDGLRYEPSLALTDFADGLSCIRHIVGGAPSVLRAGGWLIMEHGYDQAAAVRQLLAEGGFGDVQSWRDLSGIERMTGGRAPNQLIGA